MSKMMAPVLLAIEPQPSDLVVTITGVVLVFLVLMLLMLIITLEGKFFDGLNAKKRAQKDADVKAVSASKPAAAVKPAAAAAPAVEQGIPAEVVAAIAAAIASLGGGKYVLRTVRRAGHGRSAWGKAGVNDVTSPF